MTAPPLACNQGLAEVSCPANADLCPTCLLPGPVQFLHPKVSLTGLVQMERLEPAF